MPNINDEMNETTQVVRPLDQDPKVPGRNKWMIGLFCLTALLLVVLMIRQNAMNDGVDGLREDVASVRTDVAAMTHGVAVVTNAVTTKNDDGDLVTALDVVRDIRSTMAKTDDLSGLAKKDDLSNLAKTDDLSGLAKKDDLATLATKKRLARVERKLDARIAAEAKETTPAPTTTVASKPVTAATDDGTITVIVHPIPVDEDE
ncbi:MAG: hypothetical protein AAB797_03880 [Patescibacteria group bacterium]